MLLTGRRIAHQAKRNVSRNDRVSSKASSVRADRMSIYPLIYSSLTFPAPVCYDCAAPMPTVTTIFHLGTPEVVRIVSYKCEKCGLTLGRPRPRDRRKHVVRHGLIVI